MTCIYCGRDQHPGFDCVERQNYFESGSPVTLPESSPGARKSGVGINANEHLDRIDGWLRRKVGYGLLGALEAVAAIRGELASADALDEEARADFVRATARIARLEAALESAIKTIRTWHGMQMRGPEEAFMWAIYLKNAPEMKLLNAALTVAQPSPLDNAEPNGARTQEVDL